MTTGFTNIMSAQDVTTYLFFASIGKTSFLFTLFQYASFIAGGIDPSGSIGDIQPGHNHPQYFPFSA